MKTQKLRTGQQVRDRFRRKGTSANKWAAENGFPPATVYQVLSGRNAASKGVGHQVAVLLGMKRDDIKEGNGDE